MESERYKTIVIGAGLSGLTLANELIRKGHSRDNLLVLEKNNRPGGLIKTTREQGYITEWGPEGLRGGKPGTDKVFSLIDADPMELPSTIPARYIVHKGELKQVPHGLFSAITSPLIPFFGKLRVFLEPFVRKKEEDETLKEFVNRRFGKGTLPLVDAVVSGIYGGTPETLSVKYAFPFLKEAEMRGGSVTIGGIKLLRDKRKDAPKNGKDKKKAPFLVKPSGGMGDIVEGLAENVNMEYNRDVNRISQSNGYLKVQTSQGIYHAETVVVATGVNGASRIEFDGVESLDAVDESLVSIVSLGFQKEDFPSKYHGYGFLAPSRENTFVLGTLFTSQLFPNTAPKDEILLRVYVGGMNHLERATMGEEELVKHCLDDLEKLMGITEPPVYASVQKHAPNGIPQIMVGHHEVLEWKQKVENHYSGLYFSGIGWHSIACEALINENVKLAEDLYGE